MKSDDEIIEVIKSYWLAHYRPPSLGNIVDALGLKSKGSMHTRLTQLEKAGKVIIERDTGRHNPRSIRLPNMRISFEEALPDGTIRYTIKGLRRLPGNWED